MRKIKFRGLRTDNSDWFYGSYVCCQRTHKKKDGICHLIVDDFGVEFEVDKESVGQFTGLKDINKREIYEDDIVVMYRFADIPPEYEYDEFGAPEEVRGGFQIENIYIGRVRIRAAGVVLTNGFYLVPCSGEIYGTGPKLLSGKNSLILGNQFQNPDLTDKYREDKESVYELVKKFREFFKIPEDKIPKPEKNEDFSLDISKFLEEIVD